eukprot:scaffold114823_cov18-Phaeocystis_antarctica.AAC.1
MCIRDSLVASGDGALALAAPPALMAPGCTAVVLTAIALPLPLALAPALAVGVAATAPPDAASLTLASSPAPLWHRRCIAPARAVTPCP